MLNKLFAAVCTATMLICQFAVAAPSIIVNATPSNPTAPATITLSVTQSADLSPVTIAQVEYFYANASLGIVLNTPFSLTIPDLPAATYPIVAKATTTDPNNPVLQSTPVQVVVAVPTGSAKAYFIHTDQLNTPRSITDGSGTEVWRWDSDPFGKDAPNEQPVGQAKFTFDQRLPGQQFDRETNLHYNHFRDYDPQLGRYVQSDPIGLKGGVNTYGYVLANPVSYKDPLGLAIECKTILKLPGYDIQKCDGDNRTEPSEQDARDAKRMSGKELDKACKNNNYKDAHDMKRDLGLDSKSDIFVDKNGNMYSGPRQGTGLPQYLHMNAMGI